MESKTKQTPWLRRALLAALLFALAVSVRSIYLQDVVGPDLPWVDVMAGFHRTVADKISAGEGVLFGKWGKTTWTLRHPAGYGLLLAALDIRSPQSVALLNALGDSVTVVLAFLLLDLAVGPVPALLGGLALALSPHLAYNALLPLPDGLMPLLVLATILALWLGVKGSHVWAVPAAGLLTGAASWLRPEAFPLSIVLAVALLLVLQGHRNAWHRAVLSSCAPTG